MRRHDTDVLSLVFGIVFLGVAALWPLFHYSVFPDDVVGMALPVLLIGAGVLGLAASLTRSRRQDRSDGSPEARPAP